MGYIVNVCYTWLKLLEIVGEQIFFGTIKFRNIVLLDSILISLKAAWSTSVSTACEPTGLYEQHPHPSTRLYYLTVNS